MAKRILIDAIQYSGHITGTDRTAFNMLTQLQKLDELNQYYVFCSRRFDYISSAVKARNFHPIRIIQPSNKIFSLLNRAQMILYRRWFNLIWRVDTYFSFHNLKVPYVKTAHTTVSSVLDLIPILFKEYETSIKHSRHNYLEQYRRVVGLTDVFIANSEYTKRDFNRHLKVPLSTIEVIYLDVDSHIKVDRKDGAKIKRKYGLPHKYIFAIGGSEPRKNIGLLLDAFDQLPESLKKDYKIVIAGGPWRHIPLSVLERPYSRVLGFVDEEDFPSLYRSAQVFVFPTKYEGFGLPVLEAMACDTPVLCSNSTSLPEIAGDAALFFDETNKNDLARKLTKLLKDSELQKELVQKGRKQLHKFSWGRAAKNLHRILIN